MTDTDWPEHWLTDPGMNTLTDAAFRVFANGLMWSVTHGTDGELPRSALRWLHPDENALSAAVAELVAVGKWAEDSDGYLIANFLRHQTSAAVIEAARLLAGDRKREQRERERVKAEKTEAKRRKDAARKAAQRSADKGADSPRTKGADRPRTDRGQPQAKPCVSTSRVTPEDKTGQDSAMGDQLEDYAARVRENGGGACCEDHALRFGPAGSPMCGRCSAGFVAGRSAASEVPL